MKKKDIQAIARALLAEIQSVPITVNFTIGKQWTPFDVAQATAAGEWFPEIPKKRRKAKRK